MLAIHQDVQERVHEKIMQACPDKKSIYFGWGCQYIETIWIYPVGFFIGRVPSQDIKLDGNPEHG